MQVDHDARHRRAENREALAEGLRPNPSPRPPADDTQIAAFRQAFDGADREASMREADALSAEAGAPVDKNSEPAQADAGVTAPLPESAAELAALWASQRASSVPAGPRISAQSVADLRPRGSLTELLERQVRQLLVSSASDGATGDGRVLMRLAEDALPDTDLWLSHEAGRWTLQAETGRADSHAILQACAPALVQRFADGALGDIEVKTQLR